MAFSASQNLNTPIIAINVRFLVQLILSSTATMMAEKYNSKFRRTTYLPIQVKGFDIPHRAKGNLANSKTGILNFYNMEMKIRRAVESDADELSQMICENARTTLAPYYTKQQWDIFIEYYSSEALRNKIRQQIIFCADLNGVIVGCVGLDSDFVVGFYTHLHYLNKGIGAKMMKHLETVALERNLKEIQLAASPVGLKFYLKNGWRKVRDIIIDHYGVGFEETLMAKELQHS
jgi:GNAT superfamily N-acetyltransferase